MPKFSLKCIILEVRWLFKGVESVTVKFLIQEKY